MSERIARRTFLSAAWLASLGALTPPVSAQGTTDTPLLPRLEGQTADGRTLRLADLRGRVVLVFYWSTGCAVCRDKMHELRANMTGWRDRPFSVLGVNMDERLSDFQDYERLVAGTVAPHQRFPSLLGHAPGFIDSLERPTQLPTAYIVDAQGRLVERHVGRIPPQAWDRIAELI